MQFISSITDAKAFSRQARAAGKTLGLVATMGALHEGHLSLVSRAKRDCACVVASIFVNPTQFAPDEDLSRYPRNLDQDIRLLDPLGVAAVFAPAAADMYPEGFETFADPGEVAAPLEGAVRPGHFRGVATVVLKLLNIVRPDLAYFGQKDFQQVLVVRRLIADFNLDTRLVICRIVRDPDGLAKSSRNAYLTVEERRAAPVLHRSLQEGQRLVWAGQTVAGEILQAIEGVFASEPRARLEYAAVVEPTKLRAIERVGTGCVALVAARVGAARLVDNLIFGPREASEEDLLQAALKDPRGSRES